MSCRYTCTAQRPAHARRKPTYRPTVSESPITHKCRFGLVIATGHESSAKRTVTIDMHEAASILTVKSSLFSQEAYFVLGITAHKADHDRLLLSPLEPVDTA